MTRVTHPITNPLQLFQLERLRRAFFCKRVAASSAAHRLADLSILSLYRACVAAGVKDQADELCRQFRINREHDARTRAPIRSHAAAA